MSDDKLPEGYSELDPKKHGIGGLIKGFIKEREQDAVAEPWEGYVVAFFPKIEGIGSARVSYAGPPHTLAQTPEAAISKFMDGVCSTGPGSSDWAGYHDAGHRVRKVRIIDLGDA